MSRERLPNRRPAVHGTFRVGEVDYIVGVGFNRLGLAREVFMDGHKAGSQYEKLLDDACIVISQTLQLGTRAQKLLASIDSVDGPAGDRSLIGVILAKVVEIEAGATQIIGEIEAHRASHDAEAQREAVAQAYS